MRRTVLLSTLIFMFNLFSILQAQPDTLWTKTYGGASTEMAVSLASTGDGGYLIAAETQTFSDPNGDLWLVRVNADGDTLWTKLYGGDGRDCGGTLEPTSDGGYILATATESSWGAGSSDAWLVKITANGDTTWTKTFGDDNGQSASAAIQTSDGGYAVVGRNFRPGQAQYENTDVWLIKTDSDGNELWSKLYGGSEPEWGLGIRETSEDSLIIIASTESYGSGPRDLWLLKTNANGDSLWSETYGGIGNDADDNNGDIIVTGNGDYLITVATESFGAGEGTSDIWLLKTNASGDSLWSYTYGGDGADTPMRIEPTADGGYLIAGMTNSYGPGDLAGYLVKTDANGDSTWTKAVGGSGMEAFFDVEEISADNYLALGITTTWGAGDMDGWLVKLGTASVVDSAAIKDSLALVALYNSTDGANWSSNSNWLVAEDMGTWAGVTMTNHRVTGLSLFANMLAGPIPESIGNLTALTTLDLGYNQLTGPIPDSIGNLINLTSLNLEQNELSGDIPTEVGNLVNLTELKLGWNQLTGTIPDGIGNLVNLTELWLHDNQLSGAIPATIGNLVNLTRLNAAYNDFTGAIPAEIGNLVNLVYLNLDNNALTGEIPGTIGNLVSLTGLGLSNNQLEGSVPSEITNLTNLTNLMLYVNRLNDLPDLSPMTALQYMIITNNQFTFEDIEPNMNVASEWNYYSPQDSLGEERDTTVIIGYPFTLHVPVGGSANHYQWIRNWGELPRDTSDTYTATSATMDHAGEYVLKITSSIVTDLTLYSQPINVSVVYPGSMEQDSLALVAFYNSTDGANWTNPWDLGTPVSSWEGVYVFYGRVGWLSLEGRSMRGPLPPEIGNLGALTSLNINGNVITGSIPTEIGNLVNLTTLALHSDSLTGVIPPEIGNLTNLTMLEISGNLLTGSVPVEIGNLVNLTTLRLTGSELTGTVPESFSNLVNLQYLGLSHNQLSGPIPAVLGSMTSLGSLSLDGNQFSGSIPDTLANLVNLTVLTASYNQLSETIPQSLGSLSSLQLLNLGYNQLTGAIPDAIGSMSSLSNLALSGNQLTGAVPATFNNLGNLLHLHLAENRLVDLPDLTSLTGTLGYLWIQRNRLTFEDLEPNMGVPATSFLYSPQDSVGSKVDTTVYAGDRHTITFPVGGANNAYSWTRSGYTLTDVTGDTYVIDSLGIEDTGDYMVRVTNSVVSGLTLISHPYHVEVVDTSPPAMPSGVAVITVEQDWVRLSWLPNPEPDIAHYVIFMDTVAGFTPTMEDSVTQSYGPDTSMIVIGLTTGTTYYFRVSAVDTYGNYSAYSDEVSATPGTVGIVDRAGIPEVYALHPNYPNPFNPSTTIRYDMPEAGEVTLIVYDMLGREVVRLVQGRVEVGYQGVIWNGRTEYGREVPSGIYIARMITAGYTKSMKMLLLK